MVDHYHLYKAKRPSPNDKTTFRASTNNRWALRENVIKSKPPCAQVCGNEKVWKRWFDTDQPEEEEMPDGYNQSLDVFRKLLMIRAWCPDRIIPQARKYIANSLGRIVTVFCGIDVRLYVRSFRSLFSQKQLINSYLIFNF